MTKVGSAILFIIFELSMLGSCALMILWCIIPNLFVVYIFTDSASVLYYGPFFWSRLGKNNLYDHVTGLFRFIQVMFGLSLIACAATPILAVVGYVKKSFRRVFGYAIFGCAVLFAIFSFVYTFQYIWSYCRQTYMFTKNPIPDVTINVRGFETPTPLLLVWPMTIVMFCLGGVVVIHKFDDERF